MSGRATLGSVLPVSLLLAVGGCSNSSGPGADPSRHGFAGTTQAAAMCPAQSVSINDVAGILVEPITATGPVAGDAQSCEYSTGGFPAITISVRPGLGRSTVAAWVAGRMPLKVSPITGVGDAAVWQASLHEVIAQKHDLLCDIQVRGGDEDIALTTDALPGALGVLCNKIFSDG